MLLEELDNDLNNRKQHGQQLYGRASPLNKGQN